jgi:DNA repair exonuclease SbcCD ATPase subunit
VIEHKLIRCEPDDPERCQSVSPRSGQCPYKSAHGSKYCQRHGANKHVEAERKKSLKLYRLQIWQQRLEEFAESEQATTLRNEIAILRITLEEILNKCQDNNALLLYSQKISDLALKIEKLITSSHRIEKSLGQLLDKSTALNFAGQVVDIISQHVEDPAVVDAISNSMIDALSTLTKPG